MTKSRWQQHKEDLEKYKDDEAAREDRIVELAAMGLPKKTVEALVGCKVSDDIYQYGQAEGARFAFSRLQDLIREGNVTATQYYLNTFCTGGKKTALNSKGKSRPSVTEVAKGNFSSLFSED